MRGRLAGAAGGTGPRCKQAATSEFPETERGSGLPKRRLFAGRRSFVRATTSPVPDREGVMPLITTNAGPLTYTEGTSLTVLAPNLTLTDATNPILATIRIADGAFPGSVDFLDADTSGTSIV